MYHYLTVDIVMRDCESIEDAMNKCSDLMPQYPDESTKHMESWAFLKVREPSTGKIEEFDG